MIPKPRETDLLVHQIDDEMVVYNRTLKQAHRLNETAAKVWKLVDGDRTTADIAAHLNLDESLIALSIDQLAGADLLERAGSLPVSRRGALRRVAAVAAIGFVLPAVTSISAPLAAQSRSRKDDVKKPPRDEKKEKEVPPAPAKPGTPNPPPVDGRPNPPPGQERKDEVTGNGR